jgi:O-antigen/teichoic acid export membrane protein
MFNKILSKVRSSDFIRNAATLATGTTIAQAISIFTAPILYRIYDKEDYGTLGLYMAVIGVVGVFSTMEYFQAILLEKEDDDAKQIMWLTQVINISLTFILLLLVLVLNETIARWLNNPDLEIWLYILPISIFFSGLNEILRAWANRKKEYNIMSFNAILTALLVPCVSISVGIFNASVLGLFLGLLTSHIIPPFILLITLTRKDDLGLKYFNWTKIKGLAKKYINFPKFTLPAQFIYRLVDRMPIFILNHFMGVGVVGLYSLCTRMVSLPISLISSALSSVYKQKAAEVFNTSEDMKDLFSSTLKLLIAVAIPPFITLVLFGPVLFGFVFGKEWTQAGNMAQILALMYSLSLIVSPLSFIYLLKNRQKEDFLMHILILVLTTLSLLGGFYITPDSYVIPLVLYTIFYSIIYLIYLFRSYNLSK